MSDDKDDPGPLGKIAGGLGGGLEGVSGLLDDESEAAGVLDGLGKGLSGATDMLGGGSGDAGKKSEGSGGLVGGLADGLGGAAEQLGGMLGDDEEMKDVETALETVSDAANAVKAGVETAEALGKVAGALSGGDVGGAASNIGNALGGAGAGVGALADGLGDLMPEELQKGFAEASKVADSVGQIARGAGQLVDGLVELVEELTGQRQEVVGHLTVAGEEVQFRVRSAHLVEAIGGITDCTIEARVPNDSGLDEEELLSKGAHLRLERGEEQRSVRGLIRYAHLSRRPEHTVVHLEIVPAAWTLTQTIDSRIYQDVSVPDLVERIMRERLGAGGAIRKDLTQTYKAHEYLVQYRESPWAFIRRLCDEEGIFLYFDHEEEDEREVLVLADSHENRPVLREDADGQIRYEPNQERIRGREVAYAVHRHRRMGPTDAAVRGYDWTNPGLRVHEEQTGRGPWGHQLEVYDHSSAVRHHDYSEGSGSYHSHTAARGARFQIERLDLARHSWRVETTVVSARPAHTFELVGTDEHDHRYLVLAIDARFTTDDNGGELQTSMDVIPAEMPYRPPLPRRPMVPGPETATVVGPAGEEIHTDRHGRIKVQFHWDRQGKRDEHSSAWVRVTQGWAGTGWGFMFIPRIGMEVIVSFLGGDPDRPIVTGCVYNGGNTPPYPLPEDKTKSTIKTKSSVGDGGSNELRFEDKAGSEEIYIHAEKNLNEVVKHSHSTSVKANQSNSVGGNQSETIGANQTITVKKEQKLTVKKDREKIVEESEHNSVTVDRAHFVGRNENITIGNHQNITIEEGNRSVDVQAGSYSVASKKAYTVTQDGEHKLFLDGSAGLTSTSKTQITGAQGAGIFSDAKVLAQVGASSITLTPASIVISSPNIVLLGAAPVTIMPLTLTPVVINSGGGGAGGAGDSLDSEGEGESDASELTPEEQAALEASRAALASYDDEPPEGWEAVEGRTYDSVTGLRMVLYRSKTDPSKFLLAYTGTQPTLKEGPMDLLTNWRQGVGLSSQYEESAIVTDLMRRHVEQQGGEMQLTGHSLGGGLAAYNGMRTGLETNTFNAAGVHPNTLRRAGVLGGSQDHITNYSAPGDFLTDMQEGDGMLGSLAPDALGRQRSVIPYDENGQPMDPNTENGLTMHGMEGLSRGMERGRGRPRERGSW